ncbi:50S ribosomal protein L32 [Fannyhessea vaginae]|nr:50S ribosomal protein L32 [Fannyhessea vaginae]
MAVPKQKKGRGATHTRRSANSKLAVAARSVCPRCAATKLPHHVCTNCGYYKDREVVVTD